jgi:hypothetical protein
MLLVGTILVVALISLNNIAYACDPDPHQGSLVDAPGSYLADSSDHGTNWSPSDTKGQMTFNQATCRYEKIVLGLPLNTHYEWKVAFNGHWGGDKGCDNNNNCQFNSSSSGAVLLIYNPYNDQLSTIPISGNTTTTTSTSTTTATTTTGTSNTTVLPGCNIFPAESCQSGDQFHANPGVDAKRWQTPKPGTTGYQPSYQDYYTLVGYADIIYTDTSRQSANVCLRTIHKNASTVTFTYIFDNVTQTNSCKIFTNTYTNILQAVIVASDNSTLKLPEIDFIWNAKPLVNRSGDYRNGQKGAVAELFGWPHADVKDECEFLSKAGYLGVKVFPVHEQLMSTQPMENAMNPWYFMYVNSFM